MDLVSYYQSVPESIIKDLSANRNQLKDLSKQLNGDNYEKLLATAQQIEKDFSSLGDLIEAYKAKVLVAKYNIKSLKYNEAKTTINNGLSFSDKNQYLFLRAYFLLWQAKHLSHVGEFREIESSFTQVIKLGEQLQIKELIISPSMSLSATYYNNDYNKEALALAQKTLFLTKNDNAEYTISLLQIAGIAAFNLHYYQLSNSYLNESIQTANKINNPYFMAISYSLLGLTMAEEQNFSQSNKFYSQAQLAVEQISESSTKSNTLSMVLGYQAKAKLIEGDFEQAISHYQQSLSIITDLKIEPKSTIYQLNQGLAIALEKTGNTTKAHQYYTIAKTYEKKAKAEKETNNCLLSFMPSNCKNQY